MENQEKKAVKSINDIEKDLKKKYGTIYKIEVENDGKPIVGYFKDIDFKTASVVAQMNSSDPFGASKVLVQNTIIKENSDIEILDNWKVTISVGQELQRLVELPNVSVAKL